MKSRNNKKGILCIIVATLGFSAIPILAQVGLSANMSAATLLFYRFFIAAIVFLVYCKARNKSIYLEKKEQYFKVVIAGVIYSAQCIFFFSSFKYISASMGEIIYHCYPLFVLIMAYIFLKEKVTVFKVIGVIGSVVGVMLVVYGPLDTVEIKGIIYVVLTALISSVYMVYTKKSTASVDTTVLTLYLCLVCSAVYLIYSLLFNEFTLIASVPTAVNVLILAVCSTVLGFFFFMKAISLLPVGLVSVLSLLEPVFTIVLAFVILDIRLSMLQMIGTAIVLFSICIYEKD